MISYKKSKEILRKSKIKIGDEYVDTNNCLDRVTSSNIYVKSNYPLGNNAAFDGYAIKSIDTNKLHKKTDIYKDKYINKHFYTDEHT